MLEMERQEKACKKFMVQNLVFLGFGLFAIAGTIGAWLTSADVSKHIEKGFLFLGLSLFIPIFCSPIPILVTIKWFKDEKDKTDLLKYLKTT